LMAFRRTLETQHVLQECSSLKPAAHAHSNPDACSKA
jgi:hypothetical protein